MNIINVFLGIGDWGLGIGDWGLGSSCSLSATISSVRQAPILS